MGVTFGNLFKAINIYNQHLDAIRGGFIIIISLIIINMAFTCTLSICMYHKLNPQTQEYTHLYNGQPVPEFTIIDGELPD
jgi:hypothetical protein